MPQQHRTTVILSITSDLITAKCLPNNAYASSLFIVQVIRFGHDWDPTCMKMDEVLYSIAEKVKNFAVIYLVDITEVPDFNKM